jgi:hypothetical protein
MKGQQLTNRALAAKSSAMQGNVTGKRRPQQQGTGFAALMKGVMLIGSTVAIAGCISVNAPDKPIVIELNINIKQEVVYRLAADAGNTIKENADIF